jgi:hypothetical protein
VPVALFVALKLDVQPAACVHAGVGDADVLDLFEVEEAFAVCEGVQRHNAQTVHSILRAVRQPSELILVSPGSLA